MRRRLLGLSIASVLLLVRSTPALACQPGPWTKAAPYAAPVTLVPKNVPAVYFFPGWKLSGQCQASAVALTRAPSTPVAIAASATEPNVHLLSAELEEGASYLFDYSGDCLANGTGQTTFEAGGSRPLPLETGKLELVASGRGAISWWDGACSWGVDATWARLRLRPSCELVPFLPVTRFVAEANGKVWWSSAVGSSQGTEVADNRNVDLIWSSCSTPASWLPASGKVLVTMRAHVIGAAADPAPAQLTVAMPCDGMDASAPPAQPEGLVDLVGPCISDMDASAPASDGGPDADSSATAPDADSSATAPEAGPSDATADQDAGGGTDAPKQSEGATDLQPIGGCACGVGRSGSDFALFAWIAVAVIAWRVRRGTRG